MSPNQRMNSPMERGPAQAVILVLVLMMPQAATGRSGDRWRTDRLCGTALSEPVTTTLAGCDAAACVDLTGTLRVCSCIRREEFSSAQPWKDVAVQFVLREGDRELRNWKVPTPPHFASGNYFWVRRADLDADGRDEFVLEALEALSNGMGISYSSLFVIDPQNPTQLPPTAIVEDFGVVGLLSRSTDDAQCRLLETHWCSGSDSVRGPGLYLVGRWLRYVGGQLSPEPERPIVCRRYLYSFQSERNAATAAGKALRWFADPRTSVAECPKLPCR